MRVFITGATGLIGRRLVLDRLERGDDLVVLSRDAEKAAAVFAAQANPHVMVLEGDPAIPGAWQAEIGACDAVVNLAGAGVTDRRWNEAYKSLLISSRVQSTTNVADAVVRATRRPGVLVNASAIGWYGDCGERIVDESSPAGDDFLAQLCVQWERTVARATESGTRVVMLRIGVVLDPRGGAIKQLLPPFRMFLGGPIGSGRQFMSWIHWRDLIGIIHLALTNPGARGPLNATAPQAVTNRRFSKALGRTIRRPSALPVPRPALRLALGEVADVILMSQRIVPARALQLGYQFMYPEINAAMDSLVGSRSKTTAPSVSSRAMRNRLEHEQRRDMPPAAVSMLAIDVDGTLLGPNRTLSRDVIQACRAAHRAGCAIVLATARSPRGLDAVLQALDTPGAVICANGALVWDPRKKQPLFHRALNGAIAKRIVDLARRRDSSMLIGVEVLDRWYTDRHDPALAADPSRYLPPDRVGPLDDVLAGEVTKLNLFGRPEKLARLHHELMEEFVAPRLAAIAPADPRLMQIIHPDADKGAALEQLATTLKIAPEQVMAIGDAANDAGMLRFAGFAVAMGNADPSILALADTVVEANDRGGVARAIQRYVLR